MINEQDKDKLTSLVVTIPPRVPPRRIPSRWQSLAVVIYPTKEDNAC